MNNNRALLIGINAYPGCPLAGCLNDVANVRARLIVDGLIEHSGICTLTDADATTANWLDACRWLAAEAGPGDRRFFAYSGHGAKSPDGRHELCCPVDFDWSPERWVSDLEFISVFGTMPAGVKFNWASDSCHSGGLSREINPGVPRSFPRPEGILSVHARADREGVEPRGLVHGLLDVGFISACGSRQTAADALIGGEHCGAFTHYLLEALAESPGKSVRHLAAATHAKLHAAGYEQNPTADGARAGLPLLG